MRSNGGMIRIGSHAFLANRFRVIAPFSPGGGSNAAPVVDANAAAGGIDITAQFAVGDSATLLCPDATLTDADDTVLSSLTFVGTTFGADGADESIEFGAAQFPSNADNSETLVVGGTTFALEYTTADNTLIATKNGGGKFAIADGELLVQLMAYYNAAQPATMTNRTFTVVANDGTDTSTVATLTVTMHYPGELTARTALGLSSAGLDWAFMVYLDPALDLDADGITLVDATGNAEVATLSASACPDFDGSADYVAVANTVSFHDQNWTLSGECIFDSVAGTRTIFSQLDGSGTGRNWLAVVDGTWATFLPSGSQQNFAGLSAASTATRYVWSLTKSSTSFTLTVNGVASTALTITMGSATGNFNIGASKTPNNFLDGKIYNVKLTHASGFHLPLCEASGTTSWDISGNAKNGTHNGTTWSTQNYYHHGYQYGAEVFDDDATGLVFVVVPHKVDGTKITSPTISGYTVLADNSKGQLFTGLTTTVTLPDASAWNAGDGAQTTPLWHAGEAGGPYSQFFGFVTAPVTGVVLDLVPAGFKDAGGSAPADGEAIAAWADATAYAYDFDSVGDPLYEATGTYAILDGTSGGGAATPKYFERTTSLTNLAIPTTNAFAIVMALKPVFPADSYTPATTHITNVPRQSRWGTCEIMAVASASSDLYEAGMVLSDDVHPTENGAPDIGGHQLKLGKVYHGPRRLQNGYLCGIPIGWEVADPADAASETSITETGTAVLYFKNGANYIAAWKQTHSGTDRWTQFASELSTHYKYRDGLGIKTDYSKGARVEDDGLLVVYFSGSDEIAKTFMHSLYLPYKSGTQQTSFGVTASGGLTGRVQPTTISFRLPYTASDTECTVEYKLAHEGTYRNAQNAFRCVYATDSIDHWIGTIHNLAPGETYDIRVTPDVGSQVTTTAVTLKPYATPTGTVRAATVATLTAVLATPPVAGDIIELAAGDYPARTITISGTQAAPILFRAADESNPPNIAKWTVSGDFLWFDAIRAHYIGSAVGFSLSSTSQGVHISRCDIDANGGSADTHCIDADGIEALIYDNWLAGGNPPRIPYTVSDPNESFQGEGIEADQYSMGAYFNDISRVGDAYSYGLDNILLAYNNVYDISDDLCECDHGKGTHTVFRNKLTQGGNTGISCQGMPYGLVSVIDNQLTGLMDKTWKQPATTHRIVWANNTQFGRQTGQYVASFLDTVDSVFCNCVLGVKEPTGDNCYGYGTLTYGADSSWAGHMRTWQNNAWLAQDTKILNLHVDSLTAIQAKGVETNSIMLADYGTVAMAQFVGDLRNSLIYIGPDGQVDPTRPTGTGIQLQFNTESGFEFLTRHVDGVEDERAQLAHPGHANAMVIAVRYQWSTANGKEIILDTGERIQVDTQVSQASALTEVSDIVCRIGANGIGENPLQAQLVACWIKTGTISDADLNTIGDTLATLAGTTWTDI